jgi:hypothetical protein
LAGASTRSLYFYHAPMGIPIEEVYLHSCSRRQALPEIAAETETGLDMLRS